MGNALKALESLYVLLTANFDALLAAYPAEPEKSEFMSLYVTARSNYWNCIGATLHDDDPQVQKLVQQMQQEKVTLNGEIAALANVTKVLNDITTAVQIGTKIAKFAA